MANRITHTGIIAAGAGRQGARPPARRIATKTTKGGR